MKIIHTTLIDLWPGDVILTGPHDNQFVCRFVDTQPDDDHGIMMKVSSLDSEKQFWVWVNTWNEPIRRVVQM